MTDRKPVLFAKGALYGYCPKCGAPGIRRANDKDTCQRGHTLPSVDSCETAKS